MKTTAKILFSVALLVLTFAAGYVTRSYVVPAVPDVATTPWLYEHSGGVGHAILMRSQGSLHVSSEPRFPLEAYEAMTTEAKIMLEGVLGHEAPSYSIYVLPTLGGIEVHLHYPIGASALSDAQTEELGELIWSRISDFSQSVPQTK